MDNKELIEKYPFLQVRNAWSGEVVPDSTWLDEMPNGWRAAFGMRMVKEISNILKKADYADKYQIVQIKEKFGELRWYDNGAPSLIYEELNDCIDRYAALSGATCINCGEPAVGITKGWIMPLCLECSIDAKRELDTFD